jgi:hypothetical protein
MLIIGTITQIEESYFKRIFYNQTIFTPSIFKGSILSLIFCYLALLAHLFRFERIILFIFLKPSDLLQMAHHEIIPHHSNGDATAAHAISNIAMEAEGELRPP